MSFFRNLAKMVRKKKPMMANRMGGFLRNRPQMMERMRNLRSMRGMGRGMMNPNMQFGIMGLNPMMARSMKARMMGLPDPSDMPFGANLRPFGNPILGGSDYMPKPPVEPIQKPIDVGGPVDPAPGMGPITTQPIANPGQPQPGVGTPPPVDYSGYLDFYNEPPVPGRIAAPVPPSGGKPLPVVPGALGMKDGGEAKKYPNAGLAALAEERPDVVKKILGKENGGIMDIQNFPRRSPEMLISQLNEMLDKDSMYAESNFLPSSIFKPEDDLLRNRRNKPIGEGGARDSLSPAGMLIGQIRDILMGTDIENDQVALEKVNFLRRRLMDNIQAIEDQGGTVDPSIKAQARMIERRFFERNMPLDQGVRRVGDSINVPAFTD